MRYFSLNEFGEIEIRGAWWLTRLPLTTGILLENGKPLETRLNSRRQDVLDLEVSVGEVAKKCRLIAGMIAHQLGMKIAGVLIGQIGRARLSYERLYDILALSLIKLGNFSDLINFSPDVRHISRGKSAGQSPIESGVLALG